MTKKSPGSKPSLAQKKGHLLYESLDYRLFLYRHIEAMKEKRRGWSLNVWSRQLGSVSKAALVRILKGERVPGKKIAKKLCEYFEFDEMEEAYFRSLIQIHKVRRSTDISAALMESLQKDGPNRSLVDFDPQTQLTMRRWFYEPIVALWCMSGKRPSAGEVCGRLRSQVALEEIEEAISEIARAGIMVERPSGKWEISKAWPALHQDRMAALEDSSRSIQHGYVRDVLGETIKNLGDLTFKTAEFKTATIAMNANKIEEARELISQFEARFALLMSDRTSNQVFQLQIQFLPLTKCD